MAKYADTISSLNNDTIDNFLVNGTWNILKLRQQVPGLMIPVILNTKFQYHQGIKDKKSRSQLILVTSPVLQPGKFADLEVI